MKKHITGYLITGVLLAAAFTLHAQTDTLVNVNFGTGCSAPPPGWRIENVDGSCAWRCESGGMTQNNHTTAGCQNVANDWLILPPLPLGRYKNGILNFTTSSQYNGPALTVRYSATYPGTGAPVLADWTPLPASFPGASGNVSLASLTGDSVYIAFYYRSDGNATNQAARWTITDVIVRAERNITIINPAHRNITPASAILGADISNDGGMSITERGVIWSTSANPLLATANKVQRSGTAGAYDTLVNGLPAATRIYYRGYARTSTGDYYSPVSSFYTLAVEPAQHVGPLDATTTGSNSINLSWNTVPGASGYLILQKTGSAPATVPEDAVSYTVGQQLGDAVVSGVIAGNSVNTTDITSLLSGTRYYFTIFPYAIGSASVAATTNYYTVPAIPVDNDSTWGVPASYASDISGFAGSEAVLIPSVENTFPISSPAQGTAVWQLAFRDGGATMSDADALPTLFREFSIIPGPANTANWQSMIRSVRLYDDSTGQDLGIVSLSAAGLNLSSLNLTAHDNNMKTATLRISLNKDNPLPEHTVFQFMIPDTSVKLQSAVVSSQKSGFTLLSDASKNKIGVSATKIRIVTQPPPVADAGVNVTEVVAELVDAWNNVDRDTILAVNVTSSKNNLGNALVTVIPVSGRTAFASLVFERACQYDTLVFSAGDLTPVKSSSVKVKNGAYADVIATPGFVYKQDISYLDYQDSLSLTDASSVPVFGITLRDAGTLAQDPDPAPTTLTSLRLSLANFSQVKTVALFDSTGTRISEAYVTSGTIDFNNISVTAGDDRSHRLEVKATFKQHVTDRTRIRFSVTNATSLNDTASSQFTAANAGGASSSAVAGENRIAVVGSQLVLEQEPGPSSVNEAIFPAIRLKVLDMLGNQDNDSRIFTVSATRGMLSAASVSQVALSPGNGIAVFDRLVFADTVSGTQLHFTDGILQGTTGTFDVGYPVWFRSVKSGDWDSLSTWEYSNDTGLTWHSSPQEFPDAARHGRIVIRSGHTVTMTGASAASSLIDEAVIEKNAVLITPVASGKTLTVNNGKGADLIVSGTLRHTNSSVISGIAAQPGAEVVVMPGGATELAAQGYATDWAANPSIVYKDSAVYIHRTSQAGSIGAAEYFASSATGDKPVFRFASNYTYSQNAPLVIRGITETEAGKTVRFAGTGTIIFRNGIASKGEIILQGESHATITGAGVLQGLVRINDNASLQLDPSSSAELTGNAGIYTDNERALGISGRFNGRQYTLSGSASVELAGRAQVITAHPQGMSGLFAGTGMLTIGQGTTVVLNATAARQQVGLPAQTAIAGAVIDNPYGAELTSVLHVTDTVSLAGGPVFTASNGLLHLGDRARVVHYDADRFISGKIRVSVKGNAFIPAGKAGVYAPVSIAAQTTDSLVYEIEYFNTLQQTAAPAGSLKRLSASESWMLKQVWGTAPAKFTIQHHTALAGGETPADVRLAALVNGQYETAGPFQRNATATQLTSAAITPGGWYAIAIDSSCNAPAIPVAESDTVCFGQVATLHASSPSTLRWYNTAAADWPVASGSTFATGSLLGDTIFWAEASDRSCTSARVPVKVKVSALLQKPAPVPVAPVCANTPARLQASGHVTWYADAAMQDQLSHDTLFVTGAIARDTVFYLASTQYGCASEPQPVNVFTKANPDAPRVADVTVCRGRSAILSASANAPVISWYASATGTGAVATGQQLTIAAPAADTTLYVAAADNGCASLRVPVKASVKDVPQSPEIATQGYACKGTPVTLQATSPDLVRWYLSDTDTLPAQTGPSFTTRPLAVSTLLFVDAVKGSCSSPKLAFPVTVVSQPSGFVIRLPRSVKQHDSARIVAGEATAAEYRWDFGEEASPAVAAGTGPHYVKWSTPGVKHVRLTAINRAGTFTCAVAYDTVITVAPSTGLFNRDLPLAGLSVYPNPARETLHIRAALERPATVHIRLTDIAGKEVWYEPVPAATTGFEHRIDLSGMREGIYLLHLTVNGRSAVQKVMINP